MSSTGVLVCKDTGAHLEISKHAKCPLASYLDVVFKYAMREVALEGQFTEKVIDIVLGPDNTSFNLQNK